MVPTLSGGEGEGVRQKAGMLATESSIVMTITRTYGQLVPKREAPKTKNVRCVVTKFTEFQMSHYLIRNLQKILT